MEIRKRDKIVLLELLKDGRMSFSELGRHCRMSRQTIFARIKSMKNRNLIKNFTVNLNLKKIGLDFKAYILITAKPQKELRDKLCEFLKRSRQISQIHSLFGRFDFFIEILVRNKKDITALLKDIHRFEAVKKTETFIVYETEKYEPQDPAKWLLSKD